MQVWTSHKGYTRFIASAKPFRLSIAAIKISSTPRLFNSVKTDSQKFAPSLSEKYKPKIYFQTVLFIPKTVYIALLWIRPLSLTLKCIASINTIGYTWSNGRFYHCWISGITLSVICYKLAADTFIPYISSIFSDILCRLSTLPYKASFLLLRLSSNTHLRFLTIWD